MIHFFFENIDEFTLAEDLETWMENIITTEDKKLGEINYIFCKSIKTTYSMIIILTSLLLIM